MDPLKSFEVMNQATGDSVDVRLFKPIGTMIPGGIDGAFLAEDMAYLSSQFKNININVNSFGGAVIDGWSIM